MGLHPRQNPIDSPIFVSRVIEWPMVVICWVMLVAPVFFRRAVKGPVVSQLREGWLQGVVRGGSGGIFGVRWLSGLRVGEGRLGTGRWRVLLLSLPGA